MMKLIKRLFKKKQPEIKAELMEVVKIRGIEYHIISMNFEISNNGKSSFIVRFDSKDNI